MQPTQRRMAIQCTLSTNFRFVREAHTIQAASAFKKSPTSVKFKVAALGFELKHSTET
jgi:hypothetical protein